MEREAVARWLVAAAHPWLSDPAFLAESAASVASQRQSVAVIALVREKVREAVDATYGALDNNCEWMEPKEIVIARVMGRSPGL